MTEVTGPDVASIAAIGVAHPERLSLEEIRSVCGSALTQAPDSVGGFKAPPVKGYNDQPGFKLTIVNSFKELEERALRRLDEVAKNAEPGSIDGRWYAIGRSHLEQGWMAINRAVFQPGRVELPEDRGSISNFSGEPDPQRA